MVWSVSVSLCLTVMMVYCAEMIEHIAMHLKWTCRNAGNIVDEVWNLHEF